MMLLVIEQFIVIDCNYPITQLPNYPITQLLNYLITFCLGEQDSNFHRLEKLKNEMICLVLRRRCSLTLLQGGATKKSAIFELPPWGGAGLLICFVVRRSRT